MRFSLAVGLLLVAFLAAGCDDTTTNFFETAGVTVVTSRADSIAYPVTDNWNWPTYYSINPIKARDVKYIRSFRAADGAGLVAWEEGNRKEFLFLAFYDAQGSIMPAVEILGDFQDLGQIYFNQVNVVWTPGGDAVITFIAQQSADPTDPDDDTSDRVYYTYFRRLYAELPIGPTGETYGFRQWAEPVDTNVTGEDDNEVQNIFVATNLADGVLWWPWKHGEDDRENVLAETISGDKGDTCLGAPFIYLGWVYDRADGRRRIEGGFVDLNTLAFSHDDVAPIPTAPELEEQDDVDTFVLTCGRDIFFTWRESANQHHHLNLVRVNSARDGFEPAIDITRGTGSSEIWDWWVVADGHRVLNEQTTAWVFMTQNGVTATQPDTDLVIAQINAAGEVQIGEFDDNPPDSEAARNVHGYELEVVRGATRAFVYYMQPAAGREYDSLFCRAVRLDGSRDLADNVSNEVRINTRDAVAENSMLTEYFLTYIDPFCSPHANNDVSCVAFRQRLPGDPLEFLLAQAVLPPQMQLLYARQEITDFDARPPVLTSQELSILDSFDWTDDMNIEYEPMVVPMGGSTGDCLVAFAVNGNNLLDRDVPGAFHEPRPFLWAPGFEGPIEIGSNNPSGPSLGFGNYAILDRNQWDAWRALPLMAGATPDVPADRDCLFDDDLAPPNFAHVLFFEFMRDPGGGKAGGRQTIWRGRVMDLRDDSFETPEDRIFPPLAERPFAIGTGFNAADFDRTDGPYFDVAVEGDNALVMFNEVWGQAADPGYVFVNTFNPETLRWSRAALLSTDSPAPIGNYGGSPDMLLVPGVAPGGACDRIVGGWIFWMRSTTQPLEEGANSVDLFQGRRIFDVNLQE
jgi:hypothetical protein